MRTFIIAEAGVNHNGDISIARQLIDAAVKAGADAVKFQTFRADNVVTATAAKAGYQVENTGSGETQIDMLRRLELSYPAHKELFEYCGQKGIIFMSTPFDKESADMLDELGMKIFKIPSGEITNKPLIQHIVSKKKPLIFSTGMSYQEEIEKAVTWINEVRKDAGASDEAASHPAPGPVTLLYCVSNYPAVAEEVNLLAIKKMEEIFALPVGFSDHTMGTEIAIAAVAMGAVVIEKHFTLARNLEGPDHKASLEPEELISMVRSIRNVEKAIGDGITRPAQSELELRKVARRSLVSVRDIGNGETISGDDLTAKRPGTGIPPEQIDKLIGRRTKKDIAIDTLIQWEDLEDA